MRLIDADALMKEFTEFVKDSNNSDFADVPTWNDAVSLVGSMPSAQPETMYYPQVDGVTPSVIVQPERKKGKWIKTYRNGFGNLIGYCNQCGRSALVDNFCPNCGADMRGALNGL